MRTRSKFQCVGGGVTPLSPDRGGDHLRINRLLAVAAMLIAASALAAPTAFPTTAHAASEVVVDDFEDGVADGWDSDRNESITAVSVPASPSGGTYVGRVDMAYQCNGPSRQFGADVSPDFIRYYFRSDGDTGHHSGSAVALWGSTLMTTVSYHQSFLRYVTGPGVYQTIMPAAQGTWYLVELRNIDWDADTFDIWVDGDLMVTGAAFYAGSVDVDWVSYVQAYACPPGPSGPFYLDDITYGDDNQPPTASAGGPYSGNEGSAIVMSGASAFDPNPDTLTYAWSVNSASCSFSNASILNPTLTCTDNGSFTATLSVSDGVNLAVTSNTSVTVNNVAPTATLVNDGPINEGSSASVSFSGASDPSSVDSGSLHYVFDCSGGTLAAATYAGSGTSASTSCGPAADNGSFAVSGKIMDKDGGSNEYTTSVSVDNVAPTIAISGASSVDEGSSYSLTLGTVTDPGTDTVTDYIVRWGDGSSSTYTTTGVMTHTYADGANNYDIMVDLTDEDGTFLDRANALGVAVGNVAPTITGISVNATQTLIGTQVTFTGSATDPSGPDTTAGFGWQWSVDGGPYTAFGAPGASTLSTSFSTCGTHTVTAKARDKDLGVSAPFESGSVSAYEAHFLQPLDEGALNLVQKGRVIPVKISIGCNGVALTGLAPAIQLLRGDQTAGNETAADEIETFSSSAADTTGLMRVADSMYIYNLQVPSTATTGQLYTVRVQTFGTGADLRVVLKIRK